MCRQLPGTIIIYAYFVPSMLNKHAITYIAIEILKLSNGRMKSRAILNINTATSVQKLYILLVYILHTTMSCSAIIQAIILTLKINTHLIILLIH